MSTTENTSQHIPISNGHPFYFLFLQSCILSCVPGREELSVSVDHRLTEACCLKDNTQVNVGTVALSMPIIISAYTEAHDDNRGQAYQMDQVYLLCSSHL